MAEAAAVASIVGIASFGIQLTKTLYEFGSNVSSATEEANYIARHVDLYANVLDILTERIDDDEPILTDAAFDLIHELQYQSNEIFTKIEHLLPVPKKGKDDISFLQKVKWNFTKSRVALLVGELDYLRSTVHLLVTIIFTGKKMRSHRRSAKSRIDGSSTHDSDLPRQQIKAQNALLAQTEAHEKLLILEEQAARQGRTLSIDTGKPYTEPSSTQLDIVSTTPTALADLTKSLTAYTDTAERQRNVLQHSGQVLQQLLQQWTNIGLSASEATSQEAEIPTAIDPKHSATRDVSGRSRAVNINRAQSSTQDIVDGTRIGVRSSPDIQAKTQQSPMLKELDASAGGRENSQSGRVQEKMSPPIPPHPQERPSKVSNLWGPGTYSCWNPMTRRFCHFTHDGRMILCKCGLSIEAGFRSARTKHWDPEARIFKYFNASGVEIATRTIPDLENSKSQEMRYGSGNSARPAGSTPLRRSDNATRRPEEEEEDEEEEEEEGKRRRERKTQKERIRELSLRPANSEQQFSDKNRTTAKSINTSTSVCQACNGLGGREDKIRDCAWCKQIEDVRGVWSPASKVSIKRICKECKGQGTTIKEKYRCKVCNGTKKQPKRLPRDRETASRYSSPS